jgi:heterodisulfide reductase subunit A
MTAALDIADQGFEVFLVEKEKMLGGNLLRLDRTLDGQVPADLAASLAARVRRHPRIDLFLNACVTQTAGFVGNFETVLRIGKNTKKTLKHGAVVLAAGAQESKPAEYGYGKSGRVLTQLDLEKQMRSPAFKVPDCVVMIQCVGSREGEHMYCSRVCCSTAVKNAIRLKQFNPRCQVYILYRDIRTYGLREPYYTQARDLGVQFLRFEVEHKPVAADAGRKINVTVPDELTGSVLNIGADLLVLSARVDANPDNAELAKLFKVPLNSERFLLEAHVKLRPVDFATEGVFMAGMAHAPKAIDETMAQACAAAARVCTIISKKTFEAEPIIAAVNEDLCDGCGLCVPVCDYGALEIVEVERGGQKKKRVKVTEALCKGCGCCAATCPSGAMEQKGYKTAQIMAMIDAALA